ncbi:GlxA family transcriptional regulator [Nonomuraea turcica]|uniref:GlxA family transcriptional regulator n=1 Tax=Nonomuraea sp. G32 TaxID=3067274 RepID=UPI00273AEB89|nr:helix-turn-helix domain-containing protein [Nonomuraea sp. G32]MDP4505345.1 helix-turn-helix domain-containing protein [Nonomuraea sp. G32]
MASQVSQLPGQEFRADLTTTIVDALRTAYRRGAIIAGHCVGTFLLAEAGLLDGLEATTHWQFAKELAIRHPAVTVRPEALYIDTPVPSDGDDRRLSEAIVWARANLDRRIPIGELAVRALMSRRSFARRFKAATGTIPHAWLAAQRLNRAEELLEATDLPIEEIARAAGYGSAAVLREKFVLRRGVAPRDYRRTFARNTGAIAD